MFQCPVCNKWSCNVYSKVRAIGGEKITCRHCASSLEFKRGIKKIAPVLLMGLYTTLIIPVFINFGLIVGLLGTPVIAYLAFVLVVQLFPLVKADDRDQERSMGCH